MSRNVRLTGFVALFTIAALLAGCYGSFSMTRTVYRANGNVYSSVSGDRTQRKLAQSAVMWLFTPLYAIAGLSDMVVFNVIEFWTGNRTSTAAYHEEHKGTKLAMSASPDGRQMTLTVTRDGKTVVERHMTRVSENATEIRDGGGRLLGTAVKTTHGGLVMVDAQGSKIRDLSAEQLASLR